MTRLEALKELLAVLESGETPEAWQIVAAFGDGPQETAFVPLIQWACNPKDIRAMGAAKALHEAVLPGWTLDQFGQRAGGWIATLGRRDGKTPRPAPTAMVRDNPARAWLISILKALIAQEQTP